MSGAFPEDARAFDAWAAAHVEGFRGPGKATKFATGQSNPTYLMEAASGRYVLRRKPPGKLLKSAHMIEREFRVLRALEAMCRRAVARTAFGQKLARLGANPDIIAECRMSIEMARLLCLKAAWAMDTQGVRAAAPLISQIKVIAPRVALEVIDQAAQLHGGAGVSQDFPLARMWTQVRSLRLADGPDAVHRRVIAKAEMKRYSNETPAR